MLDTNFWDRVVSLWINKASSTDMADAQKLAQSVVEQALAERQDDVEDLIDALTDFDDEDEDE